MNPQLVEALQALGNLALIIISIAMVVGIVKIVELQQKVITVTERLAAHIAMDDERFARTNQDIGKLYSATNDAKMENIGKWNDNSLMMLITTLEKFFKDRFGPGNHQNQGTY